MGEVVGGVVWLVVGDVVGASCKVTRHARRRPWEKW